MKISRLVNAVLARGGLRLHRVGRTEANDANVAPRFYRPTSSCQIPELATLYRLYLGERSDGLFVEVGAYDGISFSNSSCLADVGWRGILIEPIPRFAQACRERYRGNERIQVVESAVGAANANVEITLGGFLTTTNVDLLDRYRNIAWAKASFENETRLTVAQRTLDDILEAAGPQSPIDVLIVDVEGAEAAVFAGFSFERWTPHMIIVELCHTHPDLHAVSAADADLQRSIEGRGYAVVYKDLINTVLVANRSPSQ
jgi:FkbM family methyltransferase